jgi:hypothetical protein
MKPVKIPTPFLRHTVGSGDLIAPYAEKVADVLHALGIREKKPICGKCGRRKKIYNKLQFVPMSGEYKNSLQHTMSAWSKPPEIAKDYTVTRFADVCESLSVGMYTHRAGSIMVWEIIQGEYKVAHNFGHKALREVAAIKFDQLVREAKQCQTL